MVKRKIHPWALGISIVIVVFLVASIALTVIISQEDIHLVQEDYYEKDLKYQQEIDSRKRAEALEQKPEIILDRTAQSCSIRFPERERYDAIGGEVTFFRISDAAHDRVIPLRLGEDGKQYISVSGMASGQWVLKLKWNEGGREFSMEQRLYLQN
ncbi:MAG: FixH family protein [Bacteroidetes bacterium]|nr:FixH family protein [Bacteroidota bacterium]